MYKVTLNTKWHILFITSTKYLYYNAYYFPTQISIRRLCVKKYREKTYYLSTHKNTHYYPNLSPQKMLAECILLAYKPKGSSSCYKIPIEYILLSYKNRYSFETAKQKPHQQSERVYSDLDNTMRNWRKCNLMMMYLLKLATRNNTLNFFFGLSFPPVL